MAAMNPRELALMLGLKAVKDNPLATGGTFYDLCDRYKLDPNYFVSWTVTWRMLFSKGWAEYDEDYTPRVSSHSSTPKELTFAGELVLAAFEAKEKEGPMP